MMLRCLCAGLLLLGYGSSTRAEAPGELLDLASWKLTLPAVAAGSRHAEEVRQPALAKFTDATWFVVDPELAGVRFRAACNGATTKGSKYPRCELREIYGTGKESAAVWATTDDTTHTLLATLAVTHLPEKKPQVVCAQIHDRDDDLLMVRLEGSKLLVERNRTGDVLLDKEYQLGEFFDLKIAAGRGVIRLWYNDALKLEWPEARAGCYFKVGCYTQANTKTGEAPTAYGEVVVRKLLTTHDK